MPELPHHPPSPRWGWWWLRALSAALGRDGFGSDSGPGPHPNVRALWGSWWGHQITALVPTVTAEFWPPQKWLQCQAPGDKQGPSLTLRGRLCPGGVARRKSL